ncbi:MAG: acetyltransferase [Rhodospirillales bacterium]
MTRNLPVIIIGASGHAKVLVNLLNVLGAEIIGLTDMDNTIHGRRILGHTVLGDDSMISTHRYGTIHLVNGIGSTRPGPVRQEIYNRFSNMGYTFRTCVHPQAIVSPDTILPEGVQIMAGAIVQPGCMIGANSIINTRASVDHDCILGEHVHIAPGAVLGGTVLVGDGAHIGTGATVIEQIRIGEGAMIAAGACVVRDVEAGGLVAGVPAKPMGGKSK